MALAPLGCEVFSYSSLCSCTVTAPLDDCRAPLACVLGFERAKMIGRRASTPLTSCTLHISSTTAYQRRAPGGGGVEGTSIVSCTISMGEKHVSTSAGWVQGIVRECACASERMSATRHGLRRAI